MAEAKPTIALVNMPVHSITERIVLDNHVRTLLDACNEIHVLTGNFSHQYPGRVYIVEVGRGRDRTTRPHLLRRILYNLVNQWALALQVGRIASRVDAVFLDVGEYRLILPLLVSKLLRKKTAVFHRGGNKFLEARLEFASGPEKVVPYIQEALLRFCYRLVDHILCEANSIIHFGGLEKFRPKILIFGPTYIDTELFRIVTSPARRENLIGHLGRLTPPKATINLIKAMPLVLRERRDVRFLIGGEGPESQIIESAAEKIGARDHVHFSPLVPHEELPQRLNQLKLFVLPSHQEGVPTILLEAMACGVVVIATPVGGIPDVVRDGETGFILPDNSPETIARGILRALAHPDLERIALQAREYVRQERSFDAGVVAWKTILRKMVRDVTAQGKT